MKLNKKLMVLAAVAALGAASATSALAFENEFHGFYSLKYFLSNYEQGSNGNPLATNSSTHLSPYPTSNTTNNLRLNNYFEQRARIFYNAKASDDLKLVTAFEIDSVFGDRAQGSISTAAATNTTNVAAFRNSGGALESDAVNLETKWVYLDFKIPTTPVQVKAGIQPFKDSIKGIFADFDAAGILTTTKIGAATVNLGYFRGYDQSYFSTGTSALPKGNTNLDIGAVELKYAATKNFNTGLAYYLYADGRPNTYASFPATGTVNSNSITGLTTTTNVSATMLHTLALTADGKVGPVALSGFLAYQGGVIRGFGGGSNSAYLNAFAYNLAAKAAAGPGTLRSAFLFTSGNDSKASAGNSKHLTGWIGTTQSPDNYFNTNANGTSTYNESGMMLLNRNAAAGGTTTDNAIVYNPGNGTNPLNMQGLYLYTLGYDVNVTPKFFTNINAGFAWAAHSNNQKPNDLATKGANGTNFMGTEVNIETGYKMYDNLTAKIQAAYVILGGYYKGASAAGSATSPKDPEDPYTARMCLTYIF